MKRRPLTGYVKLIRGWDSVAMNAHPYHTKLPPSLITQHIKHYTSPGDLVLDPFCGSGMTGVAALATGRRTNISDLSPAAIHIAKGNLRLPKPADIEEAIDRIEADVRDEMHSLYATTCSRCGGPAEIAYAVWSEQVSCPSCEQPFLIWNAALDPVSGSVRQQFACPSCSTQLDRKQVTSRRKGSAPVLTVYDCLGYCKPVRGEHATTPEELAQVKNIEGLPLPAETPVVPMMHVTPGERWGEQWRAGYHSDVTHMHHFYTPRNIQALTAIFHAIKREQDEAVRHALLYVFTASSVAVSRMVKYLPSRGGRSNTPGTLYIPAVNLEQNIRVVFKRRAEKVCNFSGWQQKLHFRPEWADVRVASAVDLSTINDASVDYVFTDPPFGENIQYAELNFLHEAWLGTYTEAEQEAVINPARKQNVRRYLDLMTCSLKEIARVLKPDHYASVVFHNSDGNIWDGLKWAVRASGLVLSGVAMLDKGKGGWNQITSSDSTARYDIVLQLVKSLEPVLQQRIASEEDLLEAICEAVRSRPAEDTLELTTPYLHSITVQLLLMADTKLSPPSPRELEKLLSRKFKKSDGAWLLA